jgi:hypothetical protein
MLSLPMLMLPDAEGNRLTYRVIHTVTHALLLAKQYTHQ